MGAAEDVAGQFINDRDKITVYEGLPPQAPGKFGSWVAWDIRTFTKMVCKDLLRFQKPSAFANGTINDLWGLRDSVSRQHLIAEQNNIMLRAIVKHLKIDLDDL
jgi:hypothetical protein